MQNVQNGTSTSCQNDAGGIIPQPRVLIPVIAAHREGRSGEGFQGAPVPQHRTGPLALVQSRATMTGFALPLTDPTSGQRKTLLFNCPFGHS
jgi:hypothetical protein